MQKIEKQSMEREVTERQVYEKPQLGKVKLFADKVLQGCNSGDPCSSPSPHG